ncbi:SDR family oxidoreductase [Pedobacter frigidisoli]|uniref:SDR family oxidoreductase n=1 Tax=Pedobacter frigidisoli TaxID=2530455 RepID=UPI00292D9EB0|nr:SDR family oxidoreductase [Pedobacter frigidisoli]
MKIDLTGKTALVGASSQGLGFASAVSLAECGASVFLMARNEEMLKIVLAKLPVNHAQQQHGYLVADFSDYAAYKIIIHDFFAEHEVDILVNNTNGPQSMTAADAEVESYQNAFDLLFKTVVETTMLAVPHMVSQKSGRIINISSTSIVEPIASLVLSNSIRSATAAWAKTLSNELAQFNITVNNILTGNFDTQRIEKMIGDQADSKGLSTEEVYRQRADAIPMKRFGKPEEYGQLVAFLASDFAAYITGADIPIDGGLLRSR